ncbi:hypothetical protein Gasu2_35900 [Galdieria sulphuraria]|uniref:Uncharacterized protein n=1 Tax=Galdieria sulphuraria TaxID=130081 RepID=M2XBA2_GALSU|nr:uncharacterized protein Gasu_52830 [Galdieria sulphuraria]EME27182.1 hypothetical protein Gasu_52830 [Galdieria sulphuraria]GJD09333.1 hypothetical protein Gasu2_35900 [Galdieria sulphuraria]|eukprot:XP_005703702.1 hypothetical protein Gasu_52830 [Galdieria sulphuraria]
MLTSPEHLGFHGWRWHSLSISYELGCLQRSSLFYANQCHDCYQRCSPSDLTCFKSCKKTCDNISKNLSSSLQHVWGWNWNTFVMVEEKLFFPWLRSYQVKSAYENILQALEKERNRLLQFSNNQGQLLRLSVWRKRLAAILSPLTFLWNEWWLLKGQKRCTTTTSVVEHCRQLKVEMEQQYQRQLEMHRFIAQLHKMCDKYFVHERTWLLPKISGLVPTSQQIKFNNQVLRFLGYSNCRLQLVVFDESLKQSSREEWLLFRSQVPRPIRLFIPYWKRCYYKQLHHRMCLVNR